ncbi:C39 family peptidase [Embleya sp. NBC_00896]|uniref:C39 family peptidase n=1 Tax=Embleya sp. NBC_00896 TaxID=2975961 RepID=UPI00386C80C7|nr:C39 family peptidase [Embleya sp. NBC_00896]
MADESSVLTADEIGSVKELSDPDPLKPEQIEAARKETQAKDVRVGLGGSAARVISVALPASSYLAANHQAQAYSNYCGPATARMTLLHQGVNVSQATVAARVGITPGNGGTSWGAMLSTLNAYTGGQYAGTFLAYSPSAADKASYKARLKVDIATNKDSIAGNVWEVAGGPHLPGHPNREIFHWVNIRGYKNSGAYSQVQDPATSVWSGVPAQSPVSSDSLVTMMGGRGYQW